MLFKTDNSRRHTWSQEMKKDGKMGVGIENTKLALGGLDTGEQNLLTYQSEGQQ